MPYRCQYCNQEFTRKNNLHTHQKTTFYCLQLQGKNHIVDNIRTEHICSTCDQSFSNKSNLRYHIKKFHTNTNSENIIQSNNTDNNHSFNNNITNIDTLNVTINNNTTKQFTLSDLTPTLITSLLKPVITKKVLSEGMPSVTNVIIDVLLQRDGKYCYYCTDKSRKVFKMLLNQEGEVIESVDPNATHIRTLITQPLRKIVGDIENIQNKNDPIKKTKEELTKEELYNLTCREIINLRNEAESFKTAMANNLPPSSDGLHPAARAQQEAFEKYYEELEKQIEKDEKKRELEKKRKIQLEYERNLDSLLDANCFKIVKGYQTYLHKPTGFITIVRDSEIKIIGKFTGKNDSWCQLSSDDKKMITNMHLQNHIDSFI